MLSFIPKSFRGFVVLAANLFLINILFTYYLFESIINEICVAHVFLFVIYGLYLWLDHFLSKKEADKFNSQLSVVLLITKMLLSLIFLAPFLLGNNENKDEIAISFMASYLIYLTYIIVIKVKQ